MFKQIIKSSHGATGLAENIVSVCERTLGLGRNLSKDFAEGGGYVVGFIDLENKQIGLKAGNDKEVGYKLHGNNLSSESFHVVLQQICSTVKKGHYEARKEGYMWVFDYISKEDNE